jgi:glycosyltransferase involved in cell wall biosynthesis
MHTCELNGDREDQLLATQPEMTDRFQPQIVHFPASSESQGARRRVLFISTWAIDCGIAAFTDTLLSYLRRDIACSVFVLDPDFYKSLEPAALEAADLQLAALRDIAAQYDAVNLQWEPGTIGPTLGISRRRLAAVLRACPNLIVTVHTTIARHSLSRALKRSAAGVVRRRSRDLLALIEWWRADRGRSYELLRKAAETCKGRVILAVHTPREANYFSKALTFPHVYDHPLSYIRGHWRDTLEEDAEHARIALRQRLPNRKFLAIFGFLTFYKGIETAIEAIPLLPRDWHLLIYGAVHPAGIPVGQAVAPYVAQLLKHFEVRNAKSRNAGKLHERVTFMGPPDDYAFACAMAACDAVAFPYLEIGQSASGPVSQAIELRKPTYLTYTHTFLELRKYFPNNFAFFDIGNHLQLAGLVAAGDAPRGAVLYDGTTQAEHYRRMIEQAAGGATYIPPVARPVVEGSPRQPAVRAMPAEAAE